MGRKPRVDGINMNKLRKTVLLIVLCALALEEALSKEITDADLHSELMADLLARASSSDVVQSSMPPSPRKKSCNASVFDLAVWCKNIDCNESGNTTLCEDTTQMLRRCKAYKKSCSIYCSECECPGDNAMACRKRDHPATPYLKFIAISAGVLVLIIALA